MRRFRELAHLVVGLTHVVERLRDGLEAIRLLPLDDRVLVVAELELGLALLVELPGFGIVVGGRREERRREEQMDHGFFALSVWRTMLFTSFGERLRLRPESNRMTTSGFSLSM